jgi:hypothetical protein
MHNQLEEMKGSSQQADKLIAQAEKQADALFKPLFANRRWPKKPIGFSSKAWK